MLKKLWKLNCRVMVLYGYGTSSPRESYCAPLSVNICMIVACLSIFSVLLFVMRCINVITIKPALPAVLAFEGEAQTTYSRAHLQKPLPRSDAITSLLPLFSYSKNELILSAKKYDCDLLEVVQFMEPHRCVKFL